MMTRALVLAVTLALAATGCSRLTYQGGAKTVSSAELAANDGMLHSAPTPVVKQDQLQDCGLAALAMVAGAWGRSWTVVDMAKQLPPSAKGIKLKSLRDFARQRGLDAYAVKGTFADLEHELRAGRPVLLGLVLPYDRRNNLHHYEVAIAYDPQTKTVVTRDPATGGLLRREHEVLDLEWKTAGYATLVIVGDRAGTAVAAH